MEVLAGPVIVLDGSGREADVLARWLSAAIQRQHGAPGSPPPPLTVLQLADQVSRITRSSEPRNPPVPSRFRDDQAAAACEREPDRLSVREASQRTGLSESFLRRLCRQRSVVTAPRAHDRSAWRIDARSLAAWDARRREEHDDGKAA